MHLARFGAESLFQARENYWFKKKAAGNKKDLRIVLKNAGTIERGRCGAASR